MIIIRRQFCSFRVSLKPREWNASSILVEKKSKFQGRCHSLHSLNDLQPLLDNCLEDNEKTMKKASHPLMYAWRLGDPRTGELHTQGSHDDGEKGAGNRILGLLQNLKLVNVLVIVSRWYGGTPLGPTRFRMISDAALESLKIGGFVQNKTKKK